MRQDRLGCDGFAESGSIADVVLMSTVAEIESAIRNLSLDDARAVARRLQSYLDDLWDKQMDEDIAAGRLDRLADQALEHYRAGRVKPLDEVTDHP